MKSERSALVRGSDPLSGHSVDKPAGDTLWAAATRLIQVQTLLCRKQATKSLDPSPMERNRLFYRFGRRA